MDMNELLTLGASVFKNSPLSGNAGSNLNIDSLVSALSSLTGGSGFNIEELLQNLKNGGLGQLASSWLGDGANLGVSPDQVKDILGADKLTDFASKLGLSETEAAGGLSEALPQIVDKASSGGSLLDSIGGVEGAMGLAKKFFG